MGLQNGEILIDDSNFKIFQNDQVVRGERKSRGAVPRNYKTHPAGYFLKKGKKSTPPSKIKIIPRSEWSARIKEMEQTKSRLSDLRETGNYGGSIPSLDQNGQGFCATADTEVLTANGWVPYPEYD